MSSILFLFILAEVNFCCKISWQHVADGLEYCEKPLKLLVPRPFQKVLSIVLEGETIMDAFDKKEITGSVSIDLTAAYDTVWHRGLRVKLQQMLTSNNLINFIMELLYTRSFTLFTSDGQKSRSFRLKNRVAQGSVLAPTLYNIYTADFPKTSGNCFMYADDVAITHSASSIAKHEENLSNDMKIICQYLHD